MGIDIKHFTKEGDTVLDPFGGSGVTAIEAVLNGRNGIQNDINPLANFVASGVMNLSGGRLGVLVEELKGLELRCRKELAAVESGVEVRTPADFAALANTPLPRNADARTVAELFSPRQLSAIAVIRRHILEVEDSHAREALLLAWSATLPKLTRTFLSADGRAESRGGSSIFSIYRYKTAANPVELPCWKTFEERARNIVEAKKEIDQIVAYRRGLGKELGEFQLLNCDVLDLPRVLKEPVDYVFTDPPYGGHIAYIDLSTMWTALLGLHVRNELREKEIIVGGDLAFDDATYLRRLEQSVRVCIALLKPDRWASIVFQHWNVRYLAAILDAATSAGADLRAAVSQVGDPIWSMHKKKNARSVLSGEFILTFQKAEFGRTLNRTPKPGFDLEQQLDSILGDERADQIFGESILNRLIIAAWKSGEIEKLEIDRSELSKLLEERGWAYNTRRHFWTRSAGNSQNQMF